MPVAARRSPRPSSPARSPTRTRPSSSPRSPRIPTGCSSTAPRPTRPAATRSSPSSRSRCSRAEAAAPWWAAAPGPATPSRRCAPSWTASRAAPSRPAAVPGRRRGILGYELGGHLERLPPPRACDMGLPDMAMLFCDVVVAVDHRERRAFILSSGHPETGARARAERARARLEAVAERLRGAPRSPAAVSGGSARDRRHGGSRRLPGGRPPRRGTHPGRRHLPGEPGPALHREPAGAGDALRSLPAPARAQPGPVRGLPGARATRRSCPRRPSASCGWTTAVETRPIKGTRPRGADPEQDRRSPPSCWPEREGPRRERDDRRPAAQRPVRVCRSARVAVPELCALEKLRDRPSPGLDGRAASCAPGADAVDLLRAMLSRRVDHRRAQDPRDGDHRRAGADAARALLRRDRLLGFDRRDGHAASSSGRCRAGRPGVFPASAAASWPTPTRATSTRRRSTRPRALIAGSPRAARMILLIDNYDSFVHNLARYVRELGATLVVPQRRAHAWTRRRRSRPSHIIMSPGPGHPRRGRDLASTSIARFGAGVPILGVCLGHQAIGQAYRRPGGARAPADARQDLADPPRRRRRLRGPARTRSRPPATTRWSSRPRACPT